jgi:signal transduction histidine kinase
VNGADGALDLRALIVAPTRRDAEVTRELLAKAKVACQLCSTIEQATVEIARGAGALLLTDSVVTPAGIDELMLSLQTQPTWSDLPIVLLIQAGGRRSPQVSKLLRESSNVVLLERPAPTQTVVSSIQAALRARQRQYQIRDQNEERLRLLESEQAARHDAERASHMKDEFLATLSHELRTPLNAIFGWTQLLKLGSRDQAFIDEAVTVIDRNVRAQTQLIDDLLDMSRVISGKIRLKVAPVELAAVVDAALDAVKPAIDAKGIRIEKVVDPHVGLVSGDFNRLQQVLWNLLTNAVKFTPKEGKVQIIVERIDSHAQIAVSDTGQGIDSEFLPYLFQRFSQADGSIKRQYGGLGLGLSIVKSLVELHGGSIRAESVGKDCGATFVIRLPLRVVRSSNKKLQPVASNSVLNDEQEPLKVRGIKVLIVDDEPDARELVRRFLVEHHAIAEVAASSDEAQELLRTFQPDVIVSDIGMPAQDGYDFMRAARKSGIRSPAIALTAFARSEDRLRSIQAGYQAHLPKPVEPAELLAVIANLFESFQPT